MLLILTLVPLAMGLLVVIMAILKKVKPHAVAEKVNVTDRPGTVGGAISIGARHERSRLAEEEKKEVFK